VSYLLVHLMFVGFGSTPYSPFCEDEWYAAEKCSLVNGRETPVTCLRCVDFERTHLSHQRTMHTLVGRVLK